MEIGETISKEEFDKRYPVGTTISADEFQNSYGGLPGEVAVEETPKEGRMSLLDIGMGIGKGVASSGISLVQQIGSLGTGLLAAITPGKTWKDLTQERKSAVSGTFLEGLVGGTEEAKRQEEVLKAKNAGEKLGKAIEFIGEIALGGITKTATNISEKSATGLSKMSLKPSGTLIRELSKTKQGAEKALTEAANTANKYGWVGNPEQRYELAKKTSKIFYKQLDDLLSEAKNGKITVSKNTIVSKLNNLTKKLTGRADRPEIVDTIKDSINEISRWKSDVSLKNIHTYASTISKKAWNKSGLAVSNQGKAMVERTLRKILTKSADSNGLQIGGLSMGNFMKDYSKVLRAKDLLEFAVGKSQIGIVPKIATTIIAGSIGASVGGGLPGALAGAGIALPTLSKLSTLLFGTAAKTKAASALSKFAKFGTKIGSAVDTLKTLGIK